MKFFQGKHWAWQIKYLTFHFISKNGFCSPHHYWRHLKSFQVLKKKVMVVIDYQTVGPRVPYQGEEGWHNLGRKRKGKWKWGGDFAKMETWQRGELLDGVLRYINPLSYVVSTRGAAPVSHSANEPVFWCSQLITNSVSLGTSGENP